ncbi:MAG: GrpB family protein [Bacteroidaceae bacterium]|nr:GrpB family protein [Bacteroidaceae bacterium]
MGLPESGARKALKDLTLEELWALFPIVLTPHRPEWKRWAEEETAALAELLSDFSPVITHIGSTAIPGIQAKPIIDILVEIAPPVEWARIKDLMERAGYLCMSSSEGRMSFNKGYTPEGFAERVFHIHFRVAGDNDEIRFRDYLNHHPAVAREYEALKLSLLPRYRNDRDGYTEAKSEFVRRIKEQIESDK